MMRKITPLHACGLQGIRSRVVFAAVVTTVAIWSFASSAIETTDAGKNPALQVPQIKFTITPSSDPRPRYNMPIGDAANHRWNDHLRPTSHVTERNLLNSPVAKSLRNLFFSKD